MSRLTGAFWFFLVIASGATNFLVKQHVQGLDDELNRVRRQTVEEQHKIHDLTTDWTYLNQPELLATLNNNYVHLVPVSPKQVVTNLDNIPLRPVPPPAPPPDAPAQQVAAPVASAATAQPAAAPVATLQPVAPPAPPPAIVPVSAQMAAATPARPATAPAPVATSTPTAAHPQPRPAAHPASLDGVFAQVVGDR